MSLITVATRKVVRRSFERNLGFTDFDLREDDIAPSNREYLFEIAPGSAKRERFTPLSVLVSGAGGAAQPYKNPFSLAICVALVIVLSANFVFVVTRIYGLSKKKKADKGRALDEDPDDAE